MQRDLSNDDPPVVTDTSRKQTAAIHSHDRLQEVLELYLAEVETHGQVDRELFLADHPDLAKMLQPHLDGIDLILQMRTPVSAGFSETPPQEDSALRPLATLGDFRLIRELGRGGMGIVFEAEQLSMGRRVALKVLPFAAMVDHRALARFHNEVRAAASLVHPRIVPIYGVAEERGVHFYAMQLIRGQSLSTVIRELASGDHPLPHTFKDNEREHLGVGHPESVPLASDSGVASETIAGTNATHRSNSLSTKRGESRYSYFQHVARLVIQAAEALQYAHENGIVHRDIKPGNLILDDQGQLWVADFGLARFETELSLTMTGDIVGTLRYMSPEQATSEHPIVDHRCDIYSLVATLYELLTLRPAFDGQDRRRLLLQVTVEEPRRPRQINGSIPKELETIVVKAMAKEPHQRYSTAMELAADLNNYLQHKPLRAKPPTVVERVAKWSIRHPSVASSLAVFGFTMLIVVLAAFLWLRQSNRTIELAKLEAERQAGIARDSLVREIGVSRKMSRLYYSTDMREAFSAWQKKQYPTVVDVLKRHLPSESAVDVRGAEWHILDSSLKQRFQPLHQFETPIHEACLLPDGRHLAFISADQCLRVIDLDGHEPIREIQLPSPAHALAPTPDGESLFVAGTTAYEYRLADLANPRFFATSVVDAESQTPVNAETLDVSPDGKFIAIGYRYHGITVYDRAGNPVGQCEASTRNERIAFSANSTSLIVPGTSNGESNLRLWNLESDGDMEVLCKARRKIIYLARTDKLIAAVVYPGHNILIYDRQAKKQMGIVELPSGPAAAVVHFSADGRYLTAGTVEGIIYCWDISSASETSPGNGSEERLEFEETAAEVIHRSAVTSLHFEDDLSLISTSNDGAIVRSFPLRQAEDSHAGPLLASPNDLVCLPGTSVVAVGYEDGNLWFLDLENCSAKQHRLSDGPLTHIACSRDEKRVAASDGSGTVYLLQRQQDNQFRAFKTIQLTSSPIDALALSADGRMLAGICNAELKLRLKDVDSHDAAAIYPMNGKARCVAFTPDDRHLICPCDHIQVWDIKTGIEAKSFPEGNRTLDVLFSPDGRTMISGHWNDLIKIWDFASRRPLMELRGHTHGVPALAISPDGRTLASASTVGTVRLWDAVRGTDFGVLSTGHHRFIAGLGFANDGTLAAALQRRQDVFTVAFWNTGRYGVPFGKYRWKPNESPSWEDARNWLVGNRPVLKKHVPSRCDIVQLEATANAVNAIHLPAEGQVTDVSSVMVCGAVSGTVAVTIPKGGKLVTDLIGVGRTEPGQDASVEIQLRGQGQVNARRYIYVGEAAGIKERLVHDGPTICTQRVSIGEGAGSHGAWEMRDGLLELKEGLHVGRRGKGELDLVDGRIIVGKIMTVGRDVTSPDSKSQSPDGIVRQQGGTLTVLGNRLRIGILTSSLAEYQLTGGVLDIATGSLHVGSGSWALGRFQQTGGSLLVGTDLTVGTWKFSQGLLTLHGGHVKVRHAAVGYYGDGVLEQSQGNIAADGKLLIGQHAGSTGRYLATGGTIRARDKIWVGHHGNGRLELEGDARAECLGRGNGRIDVSRNKASRGYLSLKDHAILTTACMRVALGNKAQGHVEIDGGSLNIVASEPQPSGHPSTVTSAADEDELTSGVLVVARSVGSEGRVDQSGGKVAIDRELLLAAESGSQGSYTLSGGELKVHKLAAGQGKAAFHFLGGILEAGDIQIDVAQQGGHLALGGSNSIGTTAMAHDFSIVAGDINCELGIVAGEAASDRLAIAGHFQAGGTLQLTLLDGYTPGPDDEFTILSFASCEGSFESLQFPPLQDGLVWNTAQLLSRGVISVDTAAGP